MSRKRRVFDIDLPANEERDDFPAGKSHDDPPREHETKSLIPSRRGPMATAIGETGDALRYRKQVEADIRAENDSLAHEFVRLKKVGLIVDLIPIDRIDAQKLTRDRTVTHDAEMDDLKASLREVGLSNPIRVEPGPNERFELIEGMRRLTAYRQLLEETGDPKWSAIPAGLVATGQKDAALYRRMVDENLVRKDISFAEMAALALAYAESGVDGCADVDEAVNRLYASAGPQKRTYVRKFAMLLRRVGKALDHPSAMPRALGLQLADMIEEDAETLRELTARLRAAPGRGAEEELGILRDFSAGWRKPSVAETRIRKATCRGRVVLSVPIGPGVRCTAADGKMELRAKMDFSAVERERLERAVAAFFSTLSEGK
ncbi:MAG: ParB N-terminal domain-containing protein [Jannaschia sp.]